MSGNPFSLDDRVGGTFEVDSIQTTVIGYAKDKLKWRCIDGYAEYLTLDEILTQVIANCNELATEATIPLLRVEYSTALWGVIFEVGNYKELGRQWIVHGITKGYA